ncbi:phosphotransferase family protein [Actinomadura alba]|uniref:Phosphotransferase n=1 Tax=Actinomadura alba TaxID=406431 RepID=A0ABR7M1G6_9ACTN|nr:phosphotransferase [Actinomadura alba]MBC6470959.1 phosphotransferase [Actinomadura alba]
MTKLHWEDLPDQARTAVEAHCGTVLKAESHAQGLMPGLAARLHTADGDSVFLKGVHSDSPAAGLYARERNVNWVLPHTVPAPRMLWSAEAAGWALMLFEYLPGDSADLTPGSPDLPEVLQTVAWLGDMLTPCEWPDAPAVALNVEPLLDKAAALLRKPDGELPNGAMYAAAVDAFEPAALAGDTLLHYDLHAGNVRTVNGTMYVVDWSFAAVGATWVDAVMLAPRLIEAGHTPEQAEALLAELPAWKTAPSAAVTGLAALWTLFREYKARYGPPAVRADRARAAAAGRTWLHHRTG